MEPEADRLPNRHVVPQHYLKGFADPTALGRIWVYTKGQPYSTGNEINTRRNPVLRPIRKVSAVPGGYAMKTITGDPFDADPEISRQEQIGVDVLQNLRARANITLEEKTRFSYYIDLMRRRVSARDKMVLPHVKKARAGMDLDLLARKAAEEGRFDLARRFDPKSGEYMDMIEKELLLRGIVEPRYAIIEKVAMMRWTFFTVEGDRFFPTTDNPAFFSPQGLNNKYGFVLMPIDSQMILFISNGPWSEPQYAPITDENYNMFRNAILSSVTEKAYACRNDPEILAIMEKPQLPPPAQET
jgi:hypothetical protein